MEIPDKFAGERGTCTMCAIPFTVPAGARTEEPDSQDIWKELHGGGADPRRQQGAPGSPGTQPQTGQLDLQERSAELPDFVTKYEGKRSDSSVGPAFWAIAYLLPPVAIIWALALPKSHPQKKVALLATFGWLSLLLTVGVGIQ